MTVASATRETPNPCGPPICSGRIRSIPPTTPRATVATAKTSWRRRPLSWPACRRAPTRKAMPKDQTIRRAIAKAHAMIGPGTPSGSKDGWLNAIGGPGSRAACAIASAPSAYPAASTALAMAVRRPSNAIAMAMCVVAGGRRKAAASSNRLAGGRTLGSALSRWTMIATHHVTRRAHRKPKTEAPGARRARVTTSRPSHVARIAVTPCAMTSSSSDSSSTPCCPDGQDGTIRASSPYRQGRRGPGTLARRSLILGSMSLVHPLRSLLIAALLAILAAAPASAQTLGERVVDEAGVMSEAQRAEALEAIEALETSRNIQLWALFVGTSSGQPITEFADAVAAENGLGGNDALLVVAVEDRRDAMWVGDLLDEISDDEIDTIIAEEIEPRLADGNWGAAVAAAADGLDAAAGGTTQPDPG